MRQDTGWNIQQVQNSPPDVQKNSVQREQIVRLENLQKIRRIISESRHIKKTRRVHMYMANTVQ